jgi:hypothetical protein
MTKLESQQLASNLEEQPIDELVEQALFEIAPVELGGAARERLLQRVSAVPLRYAPFYARLGTLWVMSEDRVEAVLAESVRTRWRHVWPGIRCLNVPSGLVGARARMLRFAPGVCLPMHRHRGDEHVLVLEGSYTDSTGKRVGAGDEQRMSEGSEHALVVSSHAICVAAIVQRGLSFSAPLLDRAKRLFGS